MNFFREQLEYNLIIFLNNISKEYNIDKNDLLENFLDTNYIKININKDVVLDNKIYTDINGHKYLLFNNNKKKNYSEAIKIR